MTDLVTGNPLSLNSLVESLKEVMRAAPDKRTGKNCVYTMEDAALAAFAVFTTQSPSFLAYQRTMEQTRGQSNAQTLFGMSQIPTDNFARFGRLCNSGTPGPDRCSHRRTQLHSPHLSPPSQPPSVKF